MAKNEPIDIFKLAAGLRCKPGDLAIVTGKNAFDENLGCIVEVINAAHISDEHGFCWNIRSVGRAMKVVQPDTEKVWFTEAAIGPDSCLTPVKGMPADEAEDDDVDSELELPEVRHE